MTDKMQKYSRPLLIIGNGARGLDWTKFGIPIVTTRLGIDLIESDSPLFAGRYGLFTDIPSYLAVKNADWICCIGARLDPGFAGYDYANFKTDAYKIVVDIDKDELAKSKADLRLNMSAKDFQKEAHLFVDDIDFMTAQTEWLDQIHTWQKKYPLKLTGSYKVIREISDQATKDDVIVVDTSSSFHTAAQMWQIKKGQRYITTGGISTMGYWPAAIGAALASGRRVICITGDGCLQMNIQELATVVKNKLNIKIFVLNNDGYLLIRHSQKKYFGRVNGESPKTGLGFPNLVYIATAYGINHTHLSSHLLQSKDEELHNWELRRLIGALNNKKPQLIEVDTPKWEAPQCRLDSITKLPHLTDTY